jgi:uncharacterized protein
LLVTINTWVPAARPSIYLLAAVGVVAGVFAAMFGVGGGIIVVPALIALLRFEPREATGTSLLAIGITACFAVVAYMVVGHVEWAEAALIGLPAVLGALAGTWVQRRISSQVLMLLFAGFILAVAVRLLLV